ncbi:MAG: phage tail protein [Deltaproteobacteria bacterium]|nr:MAG: phage tail protein [Deltaproteobacteria bacterium]TMB58021.1 MAG: phage tail protein [Deltaproteobacteria bacterium]
MSSPFVGEIRMFAGNFAPQGWMFCEGQLLAIAENDTLFNLIGTTYGGDGQTTFALPDLRGRLPVHTGQGHVIGELAGTEEVTLTAAQLPVHTHPLMAAPGVAVDPNPLGKVPAQTRATDLYVADPPDVTLAASAVSSRGSSQPHGNVMPFLCVSFIISLFGVFPSQ